MVFDFNSTTIQHTCSCIFQLNIYYNSRFSIIFLNLICSSMHGGLNITVEEFCLSCRQVFFTSENSQLPLHVIYFYLINNCVVWQL